jgi:hypothetical protein
MMPEALSEEGDDDGDVDDEEDEEDEEGGDEIWIGNFRNRLSCHLYLGLSLRHSIHYLALSCEC